MENYELIPLPGQIPGKLCLYRLVSISRHRHPAFELLFILSGQVRTFTGSRAILLKAEDILVINSLEIHELYSEDAQMLSLEVNFSEFPFLTSYKDVTFDCCSAENTSDPRFYPIKFHLAHLVKESGGQHDLGALLHLIAIISELTEHFPSQTKPSGVLRPAAGKTLAQITDYIQDNYRNNIRLEDLAEMFHFSQPSMSRFFKSHLGMTFSEYYNNLRLEKATDQLLSTSDSLTEIAFQNGFSDARSMSALFKKKYGILPGEYRSRHLDFMPQTRFMNEVNYLAVTSSSALAPLARYLKENFLNDTLKETSGKEKRLDIENIDISAKGTRLRHTWRNICCLGSVRELLYGEIQEILRRVQKEMPFKYIVFHGIFSDDTMVYDELPDGRAVFSFTVIDKIIDFLLSIRLRPLMQLSFTPSALASAPDKTNFFMKYNTSLPKDYDRWTLLVTRLIGHCIERYGLDEVLTWPFCVWNEPDTTVKMFGFEHKEDFFKLYECTYKAVKKIHPRLWFGTPALMFILSDPLDWYHSFFDYCRQHQCVPEFLNIHYYDDDLTMDENYPSGSVLNRLSPDEESFTRYIDQMYAQLKEYGIEDLPVYMTEWNLTVSQRNYINDTCFKSCYLTENLLKNYDRLESFAYWSISDFVGEIQPSSHLFHGGLGMFTTNGIPKPVYYIFRLMSRLEERKIASGPGYFITKNENNRHFVMIFYNYTHYNKLLASGELFDMTLTNRYTVFPDLIPCHVQSHLKGVENGTWTICETYVNRNHGSAFDAWIDMGAPENLYPDDYEYLRSISIPGKIIRKAASNSGTLIYECNLEPLEVRMAEISWENHYSM